MDAYYVNDNAQNNGDHEVHKSTCPYFAQIVSKTYLGYYSTCQEAVKKAKEKYSKSNGCKICSTACHTS